MHLWTRHIIQQHSDSIGTWRYEGGVPVERVMNLNSANPGGKTIVDPYDGTSYVTSGSNRFTSFSGYFWKKFSDEPALAKGAKLSFCKWRTPDMADEVCRSAFDVCGSKY